MRQRRKKVLSKIEDEGVRRAIASQESVSLMVRSYSDIFSTFDPRSAESKALSVDFLEEAKRAAREKNGQLELHILLPKERRDKDVELIIRKRLFEHFKHHYHLLNEEVRKIKRNGWIMTLVGVFMIFIAVLLLSSDYEGLWVDFLVVLLEPGGWFTGWTGLDQIYYTAKEKDPELNFYKKMTHATLYFDSY